MARRAFFADVGVNLGEGQYKVAAGGLVDPSVALGVAAGTDTTAVEAAVATLEADGAAPTQAHVTALRGVWDTLVASTAAANTAASANSVVVSLDTTAVPGVNALAQALSAILRRAGGSGMV